VLLMSGQFEKVCKSITHSVYMGEQTNWLIDQLFL
jgi:hypothetical protein